MPDLQRILAEIASLLERLTSEVLSNGLDRLLARTRGELPTEPTPIPNIVEQVKIPPIFVDGLGALFIGLCLVWGAARGLFGSAVAFAALCAGSFAAQTYHAQAASLVQSVVAHEALSPFLPSLGYILAFGAATLLVLIPGEVIRRHIKRSILGWPDLVGGMIAGGGVGLLLLLAAVNVLRGTAWGAAVFTGSHLVGWLGNLFPVLPPGS